MTAHTANAENSLFEFGPKDMGYGNYIININGIGTVSSQPCLKQTCISACLIGVSKLFGNGGIAAMAGVVSYVLVAIPVVISSLSALRIEALHRNAQKHNWQGPKKRGNTSQTFRRPRSFPCAAT